MTKEELEKEVTEYLNIQTLPKIDSLVYRVIKNLIFGFAEPREKRIAKLEAQIEKMKCGGNCKHLYHVNTGGCYDAKCDLTGCDCTNCKDEWELRR